MMRNDAQAVSHSSSPGSDIVMFWGLCAVRPGSRAAVALCSAGFGPGLTASVSLQDGDGESGSGGAAGRGSAAGLSHGGSLRVRQAHECVSMSFTFHSFSHK